ncbi:MAG: hypothetical protein RLN88_00995 [Ekhidna sp.]|uniref:hypothetical protein n=1 Tax=Ekhidna sp. TaxID=2608089 RepID=UPI0032ED5DDB
MFEAIAKSVIDYSDIPTYIVGIYTMLIYKKLPKEMKYFSWFVFVSFGVQAVASILFHNSQNNLPVLHVYTILGFVCLIAFYNQIFDGLIKPVILWVVGVLFVIYSIINSIFIQSIYTYNSYALSVESVLIIILSLTTFMFLMNDIVKERRVAIIKSINWINAGLFIYFASSLLIFYFGNMIISFPKTPLVRYTWFIYALFSIIMYICFFIGLWNRPRKSTS